MRSLFHSDKPLYTTREAAVLAVLAEVDGGADAADVCSRLTEATGREPRLASVYATILSLRAKAYIEPGEQRQNASGGRPTQAWLVTKRGHLCIELAELVLEGLMERQARIVAA